MKNGDWTMTYLVLQTPVLNALKRFQSEYNSQTSSVRARKTCLC